MGLPWPPPGLLAFIFGSAINGGLQTKVALTEAVKAVIFYSYDYDSFLGTYFNSHMVVAELFSSLKL